MTKSEISQLFDISISTLSDWQKPDNRKNKLFSFLQNIDLNMAEELENTKKKNHRIFHILNRNIDSKYAYNFQEIKNAFLNTNYKDATPREQVIYSKFFKECDSDDLITFIDIFQVSVRDIKKIYESSPLRALKGVSRVWDKRFRLKHIESSNNNENNNSVPVALQHIINRRSVNV